MRLILFIFVYIKMYTLYFAEYDGGSNSYYYSRSEGSGIGCDLYSDDEDCYEYSEYEGSGSGEDYYYSSGYNEDVRNDDSEENYPPWMTTTKPNIGKTRTEDDIKLDDFTGPRSTSKSSIKPTQTIPTAETAGAANLMPLASISAYRALLYFVTPLVTCRLGNLVATPSPLW